MKSFRLIIAPLALVALLLAVSASPAAAFPSLDVELENDANETQEVFVTATAGQFRLNFGSGGPGISETGDLAFNATGAQVQGALNALSNLSAGGGSVTVEREQVGSAARSYYVHFSGGPLAGTDAAEMTAVDGTTPLSGGISVPRILVSTIEGPEINRGDERIAYTATVRNVGSDPTSGPVTLEIKLPGGLETYAYEVSASEGWSCSSQPAFGSEPANVTCGRSTTLSPGSSFPRVEVIGALGADAPDLAVATATASGGGAPEDTVDVSEFSFAPALPFGAALFNASILEVSGQTYTQAGGHPFLAKANFSIAGKRRLHPFNNEELTRFNPVEDVNHVVVDTPPGFTGNAQALPALCPSVGQLVFPSTCPSNTAVGGIDVFLSTLTVLHRAVYAIEPEFGSPAQFAFSANENVYTFVPRLRADNGYAISFVSAPIGEGAPLLKATPEICSFGAKVSGSTFTGCKTQAEALLADPEARPLITNPTLCDGQPPLATLRLDSWPLPGAVNPDGSPDLSDPNWKSTDFANPPVTGCEALSFEPESAMQPTSQQADSPTGLEVELAMPTAGLEGRDDEGNPDPEALAQANLKQAKVIFPEGMAVNASAGRGLGACALSQIKLGTNEPISCPESSKIGTVEIETPVIEDTLKGAVYIAHQGDVDGALVGFYLVFDSPENGILVKIPARVDFNSVTGQLITTVVESPQQPFSTVRLKFAQGPRSPLLTPPRCGKYQIEAELTPWTGGPPLEQTSIFEINQGPNGGPCPGGGLEPQLSAGTEDPVAGKTSPFVLRLHREDGTQRFTALNLTMPPGLSGYLKGIPYCPDSVLDAISSDLGTGQAQIDHPSCPAASQVGTVLAGAGAGPNPLYVDTGKAYLAGPYKGAPLSLAVVTPAVAGPLDLGNVVIRNGFYVNPETAQVTVKSDPIPTILHGLLLDIRDIRVAIDRPDFVLNPTNCEPLSIGSEVKGEGGSSATLSNRFQVGGCENLAFGPKLSLRLFGGTKRGAHPTLRATVTAGAGEANIGRAAVTIPRSEFLDQGHIRTICTRVQFAAQACPKGSIYGHAEAITPLLDYPVSGPVYLRSSSHKLPDLVVDLHGPEYQPVEAVVVGRVDSIKGQIRTTIEGAPDVPVTKFTLTQHGGKKGLLINSRDICAAKYRATVKLTGHNGMTRNFRPVVQNSKCNDQRKGR